MKVVIEELACVVFCLTTIFRDGLTYYGEDVFMEAFARVHDSNMSKLDSNGNPILREDCKVMKGPNYKKPDLTDLLEKAA